MTGKGSPRARLVPLGRDDEACLALWSRIQEEEGHTGMASAEWLAAFLEVHRRLLGKGAFVLFEDGPEPVGVAFLNRRTVWRHGIFPSRVATVNASGDADADIAWVEHNGVCVRRGREEGASEALLDLLFSLGDWDEASLPGVPAGGGLAEAARRRDGRGAALVVERSAPDHAVDLAALREKGGDFLGMVSRETRYDIRKSLKYYEASGPLSRETAGNADEALRWLSELGTLNERRMARGGRTSSFRNPGFVRFHEAYVRKAFPSGKVAVRRFSAGERVIGYHYDIVASGRVLFYQCGYDYEGAPGASPGICCLYQDITLSAAEGHGFFDFLSGDVLYKRDLARSSRPGTMEWLVLRRPRARFAVEEGCRRVKRRFDALLGRTPAGAGRGGE